MGSTLEKTSLNTERVLSVHVHRQISLQHLVGLSVLESPQKCFHVKAINCAFMQQLDSHTRGLLSLICDRMRKDSFLLNSSQRRFQKLVSPLLILK